MSKPRACDWEKLDWNLPNKVLSKQTGAHHKTISKWRKRLGMPPSQTPTRKIKGFIDWSKSNRHLAKKHGVSKDYISNLRKRWGVTTDSPDSNRHKPLQAKDWTHIDWALTNAAIARAMKCGVNTARRARMKYGQPNIHTKKPDLTYAAWLKQHNKTKRTI